jgi:arsenate reductase (glutaredoxin)
MSTDTVGARSLIELNDKFL